MTLDQWLRDNPPAGIPFWPGAASTGEFGLRSSKVVIDMGASPIHLGRDRARGREFVAPFDGTLEWTLYRDSELGSLLELTPDSIEMQVQVFHTEAVTPGAEKIEMRMHKGMRLPVRPGKLGMATGVHTHTEVLMPYSTALRARCTAGTDPIIEDVAIDYMYVKRHCRRSGLSFREFTRAMEQQMVDWEIRELWPHFAVRESLWRSPWDGPVALVDSYFLLRI